MQEIKLSAEQVRQIAVEWYDIIVQNLKDVNKNSDKSSDKCIKAS